ncbi:PD-(D/E)XK nuclease family protein [Deinococcus yavapaiensis]|uniref:ATP-dependent helicase/DNAse subunit B n=1 Tax=Deinococcus yavapaiensis KR-236 TaxID=694435 RepID=A0A318S4W6_9DEIO|nr:PD-(D/E)XK nuclease family protein [Deinococcus yavapaiensis]PYE52030.1 ATP-dependent helicase/DNAse subunit B [Deinococcus yavapaiensis KR-236]
MNGRVVVTHAAPSVLEGVALETVRSAPCRVVTVNVPAGQALRRALGTPMATLTMTQLARTLLSRAGRHAMTTADAPRLIARVLAHVRLDYFEPLRDEPATIETLRALVQECLRANLDPVALANAADTPRERDLARVYAAYLTLLDDERAFDGAVPEYFAARFDAPSERLLVHGFGYLDAAQLHLVNALAAPGSVVTLPFVPGASALSEARRTLRTLAAHGWSTRTPEGDPGERVGERVARGFLGEPPSACVVVEAPTVEEEVRAALRHAKALLERGTPASDIALLVRDEAMYLPALADVADEYDVPLLSALRTPLRGTHLGSLLSAWRNANLSEWRFFDARRVLMHPLWTLPFDAPARARAFRQGTPRGLAAWSDDPRLDALVWPSFAPGWAYAQAIGAALDALGVTDRQSRDPHLAVHLHALRDLLAPLTNDDDEWTLERFATFLHEGLDVTRVPLLLAKAGVRVLSPINAAGRTFEHVWMLGLADGVYPARPASEGLLDSFARARLTERGAPLPDASTRAALERAFFYVSVCAAHGDVTFSRPLTSVDGRALRPSVFLASVAPRAVNVHAVAGSRFERARQDALTGRVSDDVARGARREEDRERGRDTVRLDAIDAAAHRWSASQLHAFGACRFQWFTKSALRLAPLDAPRDDLDPAMQGTLLHRALQELIAGVIDGSVDRAHLTEGVDAAFDRAETTLVRAGRLSTGPLWRFERREHLERLRRVVAAPDFLPSDWTPLAVESPLDGSVNVASHAWAFTGFADRVDATPNGPVVTDYKLGKYISRVRRTSDATVLDLEVQLPVYVRLSGATRGRYYSLKNARTLDEVGPASTSADDWPEHARSVDTFLASVRDDLAAGVFDARPDDALGACKYCDASPLCRFQRFTSTEDE